MDLGKTIAKELFDEVLFPWEILPNIKEFTLRLGASLSPDRFDNPQENVWIAKTANIYDTAYIAGPCIIDEGAEVRHCAFIRGSVIVGKNAVVGNSTELKNCLLFDGVQVPHYNYVGDSVLGYKAHLGAGRDHFQCQKRQNAGHSKAQRHQHRGSARELRKFGAVVGDYTEVGCNTVLCPGTVIGRECIIYPQSRVRGVVNGGSIYKDPEHIIKRQ